MEFFVDHLRSDLGLKLNLSYKSKNSFDWPSQLKIMANLSSSAKKSLFYRNF